MRGLPVLFIKKKELRFKQDAEMSSKFSESSDYMSHVFADVFRKEEGHGCTFFSGWQVNVV